MKYTGMEWIVIDTPIQLQEVSSVATPLTGKLKLYASDISGVSGLCIKNDAGNEVCIPTSGSIPTGSGAAGRVAFWSSASALSSDATFNWDNTNKQLLLGISSGSHLGTDAGLLTDEDGASSILGAAAHSATATHSGAVNLMRSRGTHASASVVSSGDRIGRIVGQGYDGGAYRDAAAIDILVDAGAGSSDMPGRIVFSTTPDASVTLAEVWRINRLGYLGSGGIDPVTALDIRGTSAAAAAVSIERSNGAGSFAGYRVQGSANTADQLLAFFSGGGSHTGATADRAVTSLFGVYSGETWTVSAKGSYLTLETTPLLSTTRAERFRVGPSGQWGIGGATFGSSGDIFSSGGSAAAPTWVTRATLNAALDHGTLAGLTDDDHVAYALLAGRAGGQSLTGGTAAGNDLTLLSTSNATRGDIITDAADITMVAGSRLRMASQNRFRYLNPIVRVYKSASQSINTATATAVSFDSEEIDTDGIHDNATNNSRLTATLTGKYLVWGVCQFEQLTAAVIAGFYVYKNGALNQLGNFIPAANSANGPICTGSIIVSLAATDYVEMYAYHEEGVAQNVVGTNSYNSSFGMMYIGE